MSSWMQNVRDGRTVRFDSRAVKRRLKGWGNLIFALSYWLTETGYFGWNLTAQSSAEMACDGIALLLFMVAWNRVADSVSESPK